MAKDFYTDIDVHNGTVTGLRDATAPTEAATKAQLDAVAGSIDLSGYTTDAEHSAEVTARIDGDTALNGRVDAISIVGDGLVIATETGDNQWTLNIDSIPIANTYSGPGTDTATIEADLASKGIVAEVGDTYVNELSGAYFLCYLAATWKEFATSGSGVTSVNGTAGEIAVANPAGPSATVSIDPAYTARVAALEAVSHAPSNGSNAITVEAATQAISLLLDPASPQLTQSAAGLKVDLSAYALATQLHAAATGVAPVVVDGNQAVSLDPAFVSKVNAASRIFHATVDLSTGSAVVTHGLGNQFVEVGTYLAGEEIGVGVTATSATDVTLTANPNAALAAVNVVVIG